MSDKEPKAKKPDYKKMITALDKIWAELGSEDVSAKDHLNEAKCLLEVHIEKKEG